MLAARIRAHRLGGIFLDIPAAAFLRGAQHARAPGGDRSGRAITLLIVGDCRKMVVQPVCGADVKHSRRYRGVR